MMLWTNFKEQIFVNLAVSFLCIFQMKWWLLAFYFTHEIHTPMSYKIQACHVRHIFIISSSSHIQIDTMLEDICTILICIPMSYTFHVLLYIYIPSRIETMFLRHMHSHATIMHHYLTCAIMSSLHTSIMPLYFHHASHTFLPLCFQ